jgi:hypothetical protein
VVTDHNLACNGRSLPLGNSRAHFMYLKKTDPARIFFRFSYKWQQ